MRIWPILLGIIVAVLVSVFIRPNFAVASSLFGATLAFFGLVGTMASIIATVVIPLLERAAGTVLQDARMRDIMRTNLELEIESLKYVVTSLVSSATAALISGTAAYGIGIRHVSEISFNLEEWIMLPISMGLVVTALVSSALFMYKLLYVETLKDVRGMLHDADKVCDS